MNQKQSTKDRLKEITAQIEEGIQALFQSDRYRDYLRTMSRFHDYSLNNTMLIFMQRPDATLVAGFNKWRDQFHRSVNKGEKGIRILAPTPYKKKIEQAKLDPDTKLPLLDKNGNIITEEKEIKIPMYKPVYVFDVSQTSGEPLPSIVSDLRGSVQNYEVFLEALRRSSPVPIAIKEMESAADGFFNFSDQAITLRAGMSEVQTICAAIHEIAHAKLHNPQNPVSEEEKTRRTKEVEAESIAYTVCQYYDIDTAENSFGYIASWSSDKSVKELRASLETINKTSSELITDLEHHLAVLSKEVERKEQDAQSTEVLYLVNNKLMQNHVNEARFENAPTDSFCIYQLNDNAPAALRFCSLDHLKEPAKRENYEAIYTGELPNGSSTIDKLEQLYTRFNIDRPEDFTGHSLSVSDIVALKQDDVISYHYCDSIGFQELSDFNHSKAAETRTRNEGTNHEKSSVLTKLKTLQQDTPKTPKKSERMNEYDALHP